MSILPWNRKSKRTPIRHSIKDKQAKIRYDLKKAESDIYIQGINMAKQDPEWLQRFAAKRLNIDLPKAQTITERKREELLKKMMGKVEFGEDEELEERLREYIFNKLIEEPMDGRRFASHDT